MRIATHTFGPFAVAAFLALAACESAEERAEQHFQDGLALLEEGDVDRALVELRNVFQLDGMHREARRTYAEIEAQRGNTSSAYSQYLRLVEQYPDDFEARRALLDLAIPAGNWEEIERHLQPASEMQPDDPTVRLGQVALDYRRALSAEDYDEAARVAERAEALKEDLPDSKILYEITVDNLVRQGEHEAALEQVENAIDLAPDQLDLYQQRLALLEELGREDEVESQLRDMVAEFPDNPQIRASLVRWHLSRGNPDAAEAFLRERAEDPETGEQARLDLIQFVSRFEGAEAALAELDSMIERGEDALRFRSMRAALRFEAGERDAAIDEMTSLVEETEPSDEQRTMKIALARMLRATGDEVGARAEVEEILEGDPSHVEALKMRAEWLIDQDETDAAIVTLRRALDQSPRDPEALTLMARAHERAGSRELTGEMLLLAVQASNHAPEESLRYVRHLRANGNNSAAESVLNDALRIAPNDVDLLRAMGALRLDQSDWSRLENVIGRLRSLDDPAAGAAANELQASMLSAREQSSEVVSFLESLIAEGGGGAGAEIAIIRTHLQEGDLDAARARVSSALEDSPEDPAMRFISATIDQMEGDTEAAEEGYRDLIEDFPETPTVWRALYSLQRQQGHFDEAAQTLEAALEANPEALDLLWAQATSFQRQGETERAIEVYEEMYAVDSDSPVIANNLASLLTTARDDEDSLARAFRVARRLRNSDVPAFQDTYGWIAYRRGEYEEALEHLEAAAEGLPDDPLTQYHLAKTYEALERPEDALAQFRAALDVAGDETALPEMEEAREKVAELGGTAGETRTE